MWLISLVHQSAADRRTNQSLAMRWRHTICDHMSHRVIRIICHYPQSKLSARSICAFSSSPYKECDEKLVDGYFVYPIFLMPQQYVLDFRFLTWEWFLHALYKSLLQSLFLVRCSHFTFVGLTIEISCEGLVNFIWRKAAPDSPSLIIGTFLVVALSEE